MSDAKKVARNSAILTVQHVGINLISLVAVGYIARKLGRDDYGVYSLAFAFPSVFEFIGSFGLRQLTIREIARNRESSFDYLGKVIPARVALIVSMGSVVLVAGYLMGYGFRVLLALAISVLSVVFEHLSKIFVDVFQAFQEMGKVAIRDLSVRIFTAVSSILVLSLGGGLYQVCAVYAVGTMFGLVINVLLYRRRFPFPKVCFDPGFAWAGIKEGSSFVVIGLATTLFAKMDILMLSKLVDTAQLGVYNASATLFYRLNFMADAVATAVFPSLSLLYWEQREEANRIFKKAVSGMIVISLPVAAGGMMLSRQIITLIYGSSYAASASVFSVLVCCVPFMFMNTLLNYSLGAIRKQAAVAKIMLLNVVLSSLLNAVLGSRYGIIGAAAATLVTHCVGCVGFCFALRDILEINPGGKVMVAVCCSLLCLVAVTFLLKPMGIFLTIPAAALVYLACINAFKVGGVLQLRRASNR